MRWRNKEDLILLGKKIAEQALFFGGLVGIDYGVWTIYHPAGFIVGGGMAVWVAYLVSAEITAEHGVRRRS